MVRWCSKNTVHGTYHAIVCQSHLLQKQHSIEKVFTKHHIVRIDLFQSTMSFIASSPSSTESNTETSLDNSSTNNSNESKRVLPINIACDEGRHPMQSHILALMNGIPPTHFLFLPQCYIHSETRTQTIIKILWIFSNNINNFYDGNCHFILLVKFPLTFPF